MQTRQLRCLLPNPKRVPLWGGQGEGVPPSGATGPPHGNPVGRAIVLEVGAREKGAGLSCCFPSPGWAEALGKPGRKDALPQRWEAGCGESSWPGLSS